MTPVDTNLAGFHDLELLRKLNHLLIELWLQDAFQGAWGSLYFQGAWKNNPCYTFGEQTIAGKDVSPVAVVGWGILWFDLGRFFELWLLANHGRLLPRQNLWLSKRPAAKADLCFGCWAPGSSKTRLMLYVAGPGPLAPCCLQFWFGEDSRNRRFWRNTNFVSEPLAARMDARFLYRMCVGYSLWMYMTCNNHISAHVINNHNAEVNM